MIKSRGNVVTGVEDGITYTFGGFLFSDPSFGDMKSEDEFGSRCLCYFS
jgi:hypothetical protein